MEASEYRPVYDEDVKEYLAEDPLARPAVPINPHYCLTMTSAVILLSLFHSAPTIFLAPPIKQAPGSPFGFTKLVPWFRFADGTERNAAVLASYWGMPGVPYSEALHYAQIDIDTPVEGQ